MFYNVINLNIILLLITFTFSYISFPLYNDDYNFTKEETPKQTIEKMIDRGLYIIINIGSEKKDVKAYIVLERAELMIAGNGVKNHIYSESNSKSYNCSYCKNKEFSYGFYSEGIISKEDFNIKNDKNEINVIHNMKFILGTKSVYNEPFEGAVGMHLPFYDSEIDYNLIISLKKANATNSYYWYFDFTESKMIIDGFPHHLNKKKYNPDNFIETNTLSGGYYIIWGLKFSEIYYDNLNINMSSIEIVDVTIRFDYEFIEAPEQTLYILEEKFFSEYYKRNICFKESLGNYKQSFIYCKNVEEFDNTKFKNIYFKSNDLKTIFELNYQDLFYIKGDYTYFLILFKGVSWTFGQIFLEKYYLVFNQDKHTIGYYQNIIEKDEKQSNFNFNLTHILLILILISVIIVGIILYTKKGKRKNRANELDDNYEYNEKINDTENDNNRIIDSN